MDFPALSAIDGQNGMGKFAGDDLQQNISPYRPSEKENLLFFKSSSSFPSRGAIDFASAVRKMPPQDSGMWKYERSNSADVNAGSSRSSQILASSYSSGQVRGIYNDRLQSRGSARAVPAWLETGEAVGNIFQNLLIFLYRTKIVAHKLFCSYICFNIVEMTANMYSETREEARDHARVRNVYFDQVSVRS